MLLFPGALPHHIFRDNAEKEEEEPGLRSRASLHRAPCPCTTSAGTPASSPRAARHLSSEKDFFRNIIKKYETNTSNRLDKIVTLEK